MILNCKHCLYQAKSLDLDKDRALKEVSDLITRHIVAKHPREHQRALGLLAKMNIGLTWYIVMTGFCNLEDKDGIGELVKVDPYIKEQVAKVEGEILKLFGLEEDREDGKEGENGEEQLGPQPQSNSKIIT